MNNVAVWDGTDWAPLGAGLDGWVVAIAFDHHGELWAAVSASNAQSGSVQRWNGTTWTVVGAAVGGDMTDLAISDRGTAVVGRFASIGASGPGIAVFDGSASTPGSGPITGEATAIAATTGGFCVAGQFTAISGVPAQNAACWNGVTWSALGHGLPDGVAILKKGPTGSWFVEERSGSPSIRARSLQGRHRNSPRHDLGTVRGGIDNGYINEVRDRVCW